MTSAEQHRLECNENSDKTHEKAARIDDLLLGHNYVAGSGLNRSIGVFDYSSKRAQKDAQRVARPPRVQHFTNGMVLIGRDNEPPTACAKTEGKPLLLHGEVIGGAPNEHSC